MKMSDMQSSRNPPPSKQYIRVKVLSMGDSGAGKSCLIKRYCEKKFVSKYISTIGVDFGVRTVQVDAHHGGVNEVRVNFWDLSGAPHFFDIRNEFYPDTQAVLLVYDVSVESSFASLDNWLKEAEQHGLSMSKPFIVAVCANKIDLSTEHKRVVSESEGRKWAERKGFSYKFKHTGTCPMSQPYFEVSAKTGQNVNEVFSAIFKTVVESTQKWSSSQNSIS